MLKEAEQRAAPLFAALGDTTRLQLLRSLSDGEARSIADLARDLPLTRQAVSKHLRVLESAGVVNRRRVGRESRYGMVPAPLGEMRHYLDEISSQWDDALARLQKLVEN